MKGADSSTSGSTSGGSRKKDLGAWPVIIWEATTTKRNYVLQRPTNVLFYIDIGMCIKVSAQSKKKLGGGGWARFGGPVPPDPSIEAPLGSTMFRQGHAKYRSVQKPPSTELEIRPPLNLCLLQLYKRELR